MKKVTTKKGELIRAGVSALLAMLFAGSGIATLASALGVAVPSAGVWLAAAISAALCGIGSLGVAGLIASGALFAATAGGYIVGHLDGVGAARTFILSWAQPSPDAEALAQGGAVFMIGAAFLFGALFYALLSRREFISLALLILGALLVGSHAMSETASLAAALPGLAAAAAAFALTGGLSRDGAMLRAMLPSALAALLALLLVPAGRVTWPPLEEAANRVRSACEQYFNFTSERVAFSISEQGYDRAGERDGEVLPMLGGPANPHKDPVMKVTSERPVLLRGAIRAGYTGYSWVDTAPKSRYLWLDPTHLGIRGQVFDRSFESPAAAFAETAVDVELLTEGTSTLFIPGRLTDFSMDFSTAVYYNTAGELFLARPVAPGDTYATTARIPMEGEALRAAANQAVSARDSQYATMLAYYTALPSGIDRGVYALTEALTAEAETPYDRALAIETYLRQNMRYTLETDYPPNDVDFVSYFVLDSREGYCSYYASAMAVMARIAGLPSRYVEGYLARPDGSGETVLTGEDAHAWAEIYFNGLGWLPFDATGMAAGAGGAGDGSEGTNPDEAGSGQASDENPAEAPTQAPTTAPENMEGRAEADATPEPTEPPQGDGLDGETLPEDAPTPTPEPLPEDWPPSGERNRSGLWIALGILLALIVIALLVLWARSRLRKADPATLCAATRSAQEACMIAYRANLTLLAHMGQTAMSGESPEAFAARVAAQFENPDYAAFGRAVSLNRYARKPLTGQDVKAGLRAYAAFRASMGKRERLRFHLTRLFKGLGDFESIP